MPSERSSGLNNSSSDANVETDVAEEDAAHHIYQEAPEQHEYVTGLKLFAITASLTLVTFLMLLDTSILSTAIPHITDEFRSLQDVGWYGSAYMLASAALQPLTGKIYQKFSTKWAFLAFFGVFELGSLLCGAARSSKMLIVGRAVAGMGSSGLINGAISIIVACAPLQRRPSLMGISLGVSQIGMVSGPLIGGALTQYTTWRWCFYINLPAGGLGMLYLVFLSIPEQSEKQQASRVLRSLYIDLDLLGFVLLAAASIQLLLALQYGGEQYPWKSAMVIGLFCGSGVTLMVWFVWDWFRGDAAIVPLSILRKRTVYAAALTQTGLSIAQFCMTYYLPIYFQAIKDTSPTLTGVYMLPNILGQVLAGVLAGFLVQKTGYIIPYALLSTAMTATGTGLFALFLPSTPAGEWIGFQIIAGCGRGLGMQMGMLAVQIVLSQADVSIAISLLIFSQFLGSSIFMTVADTIFNQGLKTQLTKNAPGVDAESVISLGATGFRSVVSPQELPVVLLSYAKALDAAWYVPAATVAFSFVTSNFLGWQDLRKKKQPSSQGSEKV